MFLERCIGWQNILKLLSSKRKSKENKSKLFNGKRNLILGYLKVKCEALSVTFWFSFYFSFQKD